MHELTRILYVEDEPDIQQVAALALEVVGGFSLKICSSGNEALAEVVSFQPQLLLLDVMMPDMDGPTTLAKIREIDQFSKTPAIFMTAKVQPNEVSTYLAKGAVDVIAKPFDPMNLSSEILRIWQQHGTKHEQ